MRQILHFVKHPGFTELFFWTTAMAYFALATPTAEPHFTLCLFHWLGFTHCPGCGIGRSIAYFLHGDVAASWQMHYFGIPATAIIGSRIFTLIRLHIKTTLILKNHE